MRWSGFEADRHLPGVPKIICHRRLLHGRARANAKRASSIFTFACELTLDDIFGLFMPTGCETIFENHLDSSG